jgi:excinuclease ABC subunit C
MNLEQFPTQPGVYLMKNQKGAVIYVGKAKNLKKRLKQYYATGRDGRAMVPFLVEQIAHIDFLVVPTEKEALLVENTLIKRHQPKFNALLKDDKTFISLMINHKHRWPMIRLVRCKKVKEDGLYFGPYTNAYAARHTFELLTRLFPLRQCSDEELKRRKRPCLLYGMKRCIAPCVGLCTKEEYDSFVQGAIQFLKGQDKEILKKLKASMQEASEALEFEKAAAFLQTIKQIEQVIEHTPVVAKSTGKDCDALALYRHGSDVLVAQLFFREGHLIGSEHYSFDQVAEEDEELLSSFILQHYIHKKSPPAEILLPCHLPEELEEILSEAHHKKIHLSTPQKGDKYALVKIAQQNAKALFEQQKDHAELKEKLLLDLQEALHLNRYPKRIECFDTSNISGTDLVASMVAFTEGDKERKRTRLFRIKGIDKSDDYAALHQVLSRRLVRAKEEDDLPDLILIDGGKGQLNIAIELFKELDIASVDVIAIAKEQGRHDKGMTAERIFVPDHKEAIHLGTRSPLLFFLQKIRDEAHETAIRFHRKRRQKRTLTSALDDIPGIGPIKRKRLLRHFGSVERIRSASEEELRQVKGITVKDIQALRA